MNAEGVLRGVAAPAEAFGQSALQSRYASFGPFCLDLQRQELFKNGARVRVPGKVYQVLETLLERPGEIVTREALRARLWPADTHVNFEANVNTTVNKLRQVLGDSNEQSAFVQTIPRRGYSFIAKTEFSDRLPIQEFDSANVATKKLNIDEPAVRAAKLLDPSRASLWFTTGVVALVIAAMLLGAAITLFSHRL
jgi:DNA-binding winged helix-turn-helix (wHTH) protein